jgi:hypothetical protein
MAAAATAVVYLEFEGGEVGAYTILGEDHLMAEGLHGSCYFISAAGQSLFKSNAQ